MQAADKHPSVFHKRVLAVVAQIPSGKTMSYGQVAAAAGSPNAARAVGSILKQNYNPDIPCHRVIKSDGTLGEYNLGRETKRQLLQEEQYVMVRKKPHVRTT